MTLRRRAWVAEILDTASCAGAPAIALLATLGMGGAGFSCGPGPKASHTRSSIRTYWTQSVDTPPGQRPRRPALPLCPLVDRTHGDSAPTSSLGSKSRTNDRVEGLPFEAGLIVTPSWAKLAAVWGEYDRRVPDNTFVSQAVFAPDGRFLITLDGRGRIERWEVGTDRLQGISDACAAAEGGRGAAGSRSLAISSDGLLAIGATSGRVCLQREGSKVPVRAFDAHRGEIVRMQFIGTNELVTVGAKGPNVPERSARWWSVSSGEVLSEIDIGRAHRVEIAPDGTAVTSSGEALRTWDRSGNLRWKWPEPIRTFAFWDSHHLLVLRDRGLVVMDARQGGLQCELAGQVSLTEQHLAEDLLVTPNGRHAITIGDEQALVLWDLEARRDRIRRWRPADSGVALYFRRAEERDEPPASIWPQRVAVSPDGAALATWSGPAIAFWSAKDLLPREHLAERRRAISKIVISPDEQRAISMDDRGLRIWEAPNGKQVDTRAELGLVSASFLGSGQSLRLVATKYGAVTDLDADRVLWSTDTSSRPLIAPGSNQVAVESATEGITLRDALTGTTLWRNEKLSLVVGYTSDGRTLFAKDRDRVLAEVDSADGTVRRTHPYLDLSSVDELWFTSDGRNVITLAHDDPPAPAAPSHHRRRHKGEHSGLEESTESRAKTWLAGFDLEAGRRLWRTESEPGPLLILPDNRTFVAGEASAVRRWDVRTGLAAGAAIDLAPTGDKPSSFAVTRPGSSLLVGTARGVVLRFTLQ